MEPVSSRPDPGKVKNAVQKMEGKNDDEVVSGEKKCKDSADKERKYGSD